jgi:hypothetical protein
MAYSSEMGHLNVIWLPLRDRPVLAAACSRGPKGSCCDLLRSRGTLGSSKWNPGVIPLSLCVSDVTNRRLNSHAVLLERTRYGDAVCWPLPFVTSRFLAKGRFQPVARFGRWVSSMPIERVGVRAELEPQLRLYRRLWLSRIDLDEAKATVEEILGSNLPFPRRKNPSPLLTALTTALVVSYARPFVSSRGQSTVAERTVPGSLLRVLTSNERALHEAIIDMRNREVAHSDADVLEMSIELFPEGDGGICRAARHPFRRIDLRAVLHIIDKLTVEIECRCNELRNALPHNVWL